MKLNKKYLSIQFFKEEDSKKKENEAQARVRVTIFQRERVDPLVQEFYNRFGVKPQDQEADKQAAARGVDGQLATQEMQPASQQEQNKSTDQPAEKKMRMNII